MAKQINFPAHLIHRTYSWFSYTGVTLYDVIIIPVMDARIKYPKHRRFISLLISDEYNIRSQYGIYVIRDDDCYATLPGYCFVLLQPKEATYEEKKEAEKLQWRTRHMTTRLAHGYTVEGKKKVEKKSVMHTSKPYQFRDEIGRRV